MKPGLDQLSPFQLKDELIRYARAGAEGKASAHAFLNAGRGKDDTIFAKVAGRVRFENHGAHGRVISILPLE